MKALVFSAGAAKFLALKVLGLISPRLYFSGPLATLKLAEVPEPELPGPDWVKVKTLMCGFCASDLNVILLRDEPTPTPFVSFPAVLGHEISGEITSAGDKADGLAPGHRVTIAPSLSCAVRGIEPACPACAKGMFAACENYAEGGLAPGMIIGLCRDTGGGFSPFFVAHKSQVFRLPPEVPLEAGVMIEPFSVGLQTVFTNPPQSGEEVLVIGGGVIGSLIVQALRVLDFDCRITVAERSGFAAESCKKAGADRVLVGGDLIGQAAEITGAKKYKPLLGQEILQGGFARVYDTVGSSSTLNTGLRVLAAGGTLSQVGIGHGLRLDLTPLWMKRQTIVGVYGCGYAEYQGRQRHMFEIALDLARENKVHLAEMVTHRFTLEDFRRLIEVNLDKEKHQAVKTVVSFMSS